MQHYVLNTAESSNCGEQDPRLIKLLSPIAVQAKSAGCVQTLLPSPLNHYSVKLTSEPGCAMFDISDQQGFILSFNAVVWEPHQHERCWELIEALYLNLVRDLGAVRIACTLEPPEELPWLASLKLTKGGVDLRWLTEMEECFALQLIKAYQHPFAHDRNPRQFKGFGLKT
jgi:hypothetical protein